MRKFAIRGALFALFFFLLPFSRPKAYAAAWFLSDPQSFGQTLQNAEQSNQVQKEGYDFSTSVNSMNTISCLIVGCSTNPQSSLHYSKSALSGLNNFIMAMYTNPPADTVAFVRDMGQNLGFLPKQAYAQAQGVGFTGLAPLLGLWKAFRNIAYALLAIVMIIIGFMVMFRRKIDPKTVVTVQNALPRIIITLLLVTFSYAIVGLLIDLMYLIILLAIAIVGNSGVQGVDVPGLQQLYTSGRTFDLMGRVFSALNPLTQVTLEGAAAGATGGLLLGSLFPGAGTIIGGIVGALLGSIAAGPAGALSPFLFIFLAIALFFGFIRIFFMLIMAYIQIILAVILGPIQILLEAIPGTNGFMSWLTNLLGNLAAFPITVIMLVIGNLISQNITSSMWVPPLIPGGSEGIVRAIIGIGIILSIPSIYNGLKKSLKVQPSPVAAGLGGVISTPAATGMQLLSTAVALKQLGAGDIVGRLFGKSKSQKGGP